MKHIYTSIDIGSDSIKIIVCELYKNKLNLLAASSFKSEGIKKGLITDVELAKKSVKGAFNEIESTLGIKINKVIANIPSFNAEYSVVKGNIEITNEDTIVTGNDIVKVLDIASQSQKFTSREIVTIMPIDFTLDDKAFIKNPRGMRSLNLGCRAIIVSTPKKNVYSVVTLLESMGIEIVDISLNNIGDLYCFNNKKFEDKVGAIINIGSEVTDISLYNKSILVKSSVINNAGKNIDSDLSYMFKIDSETSKNLKLNFALAHKKNASTSDIVEVKKTSGEVIKLNQFEVTEIVMARLEDILEEAKKEINLLTSKRIDYIIITGGTSNISGFEYIVNDIFGENANIGNVKMLGIRDNMYSSCIGNIVYFISKLKLKNKNYSMISDDEVYEMTTINSKKNTSDSMLGKIFGFFFNE